MQHIIVNKERFEWIDCLRGVTMILVIMAHFNQHSLNGVETCRYVQLMGTFRMPLFFFISGFVAYSFNADWRWFQKKVSVRITRQLLPTIVMMLLYSLCFSYGFYELITSAFKGGYWFTIASFEVFCLYALLAFLLNKLNVNVKGQSIVYLCCIALSYPLPFLVSLLPGQEILTIFCVQRISDLFGFFFMGVLVRIYFKSINETLISRFAFISLLVFVIVYCLGESIPNHKFLLGIGGVIIVFNLFYYFRNYFTSQNPVGKVMCIIGKNTLSIYLLHMFVINSLQFSNTQFSDFLDNNELVGLIVSFVVSAAIAGLCLLTNEVIKSIPILHSAMMGFDFKRKYSGDK